MKFPIPSYFGLSRTMYLQTLCQRWGDFGVSWNFTQADGEIGFTRKRSVMELWHEDYDHPLDSRMEKVMHREAMPIEHFVEIDDSLSNLGDKIKYLKQNDDKAKQLARNAYKFYVRNINMKMLLDYMQFLLCEVARREVRN